LGLQKGEITPLTRRASEIISPTSRPAIPPTSTARHLWSNGSRPKSPTCIPQALAVTPRATRQIDHRLTTKLSPDRQFEVATPLRRLSYQHDSVSGLLVAKFPEGLGIRLLTL